MLGVITGFALEVGKTFIGYKKKQEMRTSSSGLVLVFRSTQLPSFLKS